MTNPNIQIRTYEAGFVSTLCNYILSNSPLASYLACVACSLYLWEMASLSSSETCW